MRYCLFILLAGILAAACRGNSSPNYEHCRTLQLGVTKETAIKWMGNAEQEFARGGDAEVRGYGVLIYDNPLGWDDGNTIYINPLTERVDMIKCVNDTRGELDPRVAKTFDAEHPKKAWEKRKK